jgi:outer membrane protein assembly factor BamB
VRAAGTTTSCRLFAQVLLALVVVASCDATPAAAQDAAQVPTGFPSEIAWTVDLGAPPLAAVPAAVAGGRVFVALEPGVLSARSIVDGRELWQTPVDAEGAMAASSTIVAVPIKGSIHAIRAATGHTAWIVPSERLTAPMLMVGGWLFVATEGRLTALRVTDGARVWSLEFPSVTERPAAEGERLYVPTSDGRLIALDLSTGSTLWEARLGGPAGEPLALADRVYVGTGRRALVCLKADTGKEDWTYTIGATIRGAPAADAMHVYTVALDNLLWALHRTNGAARWKADLKYRPLGGPVVMGSAVTVGGVTQQLRAFDASTGRPVGTLALPGSAPMQPAFVVSESGGSGMIVTVTGNPDGRWLLTAAAPPMPSIPVGPPTLLPGTVVEVRGT